jgi:hypothetical protein
MKGMLLAGAVTALVIIAPENAAATPIYTTPLLESDRQTIEEVRDIRRQQEALQTDEMLAKVRIAAAAVIGAAAASVALLWWRRRRRVHDNRLVAGMSQARRGTP